MVDQQIERKSRIKAVIGTILFHGLLFALLYFFTIGIADPPMFGDDAGVEVNFGTSADGMGDIQPEQPLAEEAANPPQPAPEEQTEQKVLTQEVDEAPVVNQEKPEKPKKEPVKKPEEPKKTPPKEVVKATPVKQPDPQPTVNPNALFKKKGGTTGGGNEGETGKPGDQGIKEGSLYSKVHGDKNGSGDHGNGDGFDGNGGSGGGKGVMFNLSGRKMLRAPDIEDKSQETGKVVVAITVDKYGNVTQATPGARGSTTTSSILYAKAQQAAMRAKFNANEDAVEVQKGTITFIFRVQ